MVKSWLLVPLLAVCLLLTACEWRKAALGGDIDGDGVAEPGVVTSGVTGFLAGGPWGAAFEVATALALAVAAHQRKKRRDTDSKSAAVLEQVATGIANYLADRPDYTGLTVEQIAEAEKDRLRDELSKAYDGLTDSMFDEIRERLNLG